MLNDRSAHGRLHRPHEHSTRVENAGWKREREFRPAIGLAGNRQLAAHSSSQIATDRQPESHSLLREVRQRSIELHKWLEDRFVLVERNARTSITHNDFDA